MQFLHSVIVLFSILFAINVGIAIYFVYLHESYTWIVMKKMILNMFMSIKQKIISINGRSQTNKY